MKQLNKLSVRQGVNESFGNESVSHNGWISEVSNEWVSTERWSKEVNEEVKEWVWKGMIKGIWVSYKLNEEVR